MKTPKRIDVLSNSRNFRIGEQCNPNNQAEKLEWSHSPHDRKMTHRVFTQSGSTAALSIADPERQLSEHDSGPGE